MISRVRFALVLLATAAMMVVLVAGSTLLAPAGVPEGVQWDPRLTQLRVGVDGSKVAYGQPHWKIIAAWVTVNGNWDDVPAWAKVYQKDTLGGDHHAYGRALFRDGTVAPDAGFLLSWPDGSDGRVPEADGWANIPLQAGYNPGLGPGPYRWSKFGNSELLTGLGLPYPLPWTTTELTGGYHVSFFVVYRETIPNAATPTPIAPPAGPVRYWLRVPPLPWLPVEIKAR